MRLINSLIWSIFHMEAYRDKGNTIRGSFAKLMWKITKNPYWFGIYQEEIFNKCMKYKEVTL